jgi:hypothetical protein
VEIECCADAQNSAAVQLVGMVRDPEVLLRAANPDPYMCRSRGVDALNRRRRLRGSQGSERGCFITNDREIRHQPCKCGGESRGDAWTAAVEIVACTAVPTPLEHGKHCVWSAHARDAMPPKASKPRQRHAIGEYEVGFVQDSREVRVRGCLDNVLGRRKMESGWAFAESGANDQIDRGVQIHSADRNAAERVACDFAAIIRCHSRAQTPQVSASARYAFRLRLVSRRQLEVLAIRNRYVISGTSPGAES